MNRHHLFALLAAGALALAGARCAPVPAVAQATPTASPSPSASPTAAPTPGCWVVVDPASGYPVGTAFGTQPTGLAPGQYVGIAGTCSSAATPGPMSSAVPCPQYAAAHDIRAGTPLGTLLQYVGSLFTVTLPCATPTPGATPGSPYATPTAPPTIGGFLEPTPTPTATPVPATAPPSAPAPYTPAPLAPPTAGAYLGVRANPEATCSAASCYVTQVHALESSVGRTFALSDSFFSWQALGNGSFPTALETDDATTGRWPVIAWGCAHPDAAVAAGTWDSDIVAAATAVAAYGRPVFVRWFWEMNLVDTANSRTACYDPATDGLASPDNAGGTTVVPAGFFSPQEYVAAWQHVRAVFAAYGATNAVWVWCPSDGTGGPPVADYYPGDAWVDWLGFDSYQRGSGSLLSTFSGVYGRVTAVTSQPKPVMVAETGTDAANQVAYLTGADGTLATAYPQVGALVYFDSGGPLGDYTLTTAGTSQLAVEGATSYLSLPGPSAAPTAAPTGDVYVAQTAKYVAPLSSPPPSGTVTLSALPAPGDLLLTFDGGSPGADTVSPLAWSSAFGVASSPGTDVANLQQFSATWQGGDPTAFVFAKASGSGVVRSAQVLDLTGVDPATPLGASAVSSGQQGAGAGSAASGTVSVTRAGSLVVAALQDYGGTSVGGFAMPPAPAGWSLVTKTAPGYGEQAVYTYQATATGFVSATFALPAGDAGLGWVLDLQVVQP